MDAGEHSFHRPDSSLAPLWFLSLFLKDSALAESEPRPVAHSGFHQRQLLSSEFTREAFRLDRRHDRGILHREGTGLEERDMDF